MFTSKLLNSKYLLSLYVSTQWDFYFALSIYLNNIKAIILIYTACNIHHANQTPI